MRCGRNDQKFSEDFRKFSLDTRRFSVMIRFSTGHGVISFIKDVFIKNQYGFVYDETCKGIDK
jgi:hypothetical protein